MKKYPETQQEKPQRQEENDNRKPNSSFFLLFLLSYYYDCDSQWQQQQQQRITTIQHLSFIKKLLRIRLKKIVLICLSVFWARTLQLLKKRGDEHKQHMNHPSLRKNNRIEEEQDKHAQDSSD